MAQPKLEEIKKEKLDDIYIDAFFYAVGETLIVEDSETAEKLMGKYRMVTLDGKLYEKSSAITGGYIKKGLFGFGMNDDKELENAKARDELSFIEVKCSIGARDDLGRPTTTALENKQNFMEYLK